jgi:hypothetical protein
VVIGVGKRRHHTLPFHCHDDLNLNHIDYYALQADMSRKRVGLMQSHVKGKVSSLLTVAMTTIATVTYHGR